MGAGAGYPRPPPLFIGGTSFPQREAAAQPAAPREAAGIEGAGLPGEDPGRGDGAVSHPHGPDLAAGKDRRYVRVA